MKVTPEETIARIDKIVTDDIESADFSNRCGTQSGRRGWFIMENDLRHLVTRYRRARKRLEEMKNDVRFGPKESEWKPVNTKVIMVGQFDGNLDPNEEEMRDD